MPRQMRLFLGSSCSRKKVGGEILQALETLKKNLETFKAVYNQQKGEERRLRRLQDEKKEALAKARAEEELLEKVRMLLQATAEHAREQARQQVAYMVTQALQYTFGPDLAFEIKIEEKRERPEADFFVVSTFGEGNLKIETRPEDARGGGVVDVISLALRLALLQTSHPVVDGPVILDEPAKHVSEEYSRNVAQFLKNVGENLGRQIILVTHNQHFAESGDRAYLVELREGKSTVRRLN